MLQAQLAANNATRKSLAIGKAAVRLWFALIIAACSNSAGAEADPSGESALQRVAPSSLDLSQASAADGPFELPVADVFKITGKGVVVTGRVKSGTISVGDPVCISGGRRVTVAGIEMFRKTLDSLAVGDTGGLLLQDVSKDDISKGDVIRGCD